MRVFDAETLALLDVYEEATLNTGALEEFLSMTIKDIRPGRGVARIVEEASGPWDGTDDTGWCRRRGTDEALR